jgi:hypothetical protein
MRLSGLCPGLDLCNFPPSLFIERQFTLFPGVRVPQPPAAAESAPRCRDHDFAELMTDNRARALML